MQIETYLHFNGHCEEAFQFYSQILGGKIDFMMTHKDSPMASDTPPDWQSKIMHARMSARGQVLLGSDAMPQHYHAPQGFSVSLSLADFAEAQRIFDSLAEGGIVKMPLQKTFWTEGFGMLVDRFGIPWMLNCDPNA
jgi:PhnB protein